jgi:KilA-N domain
VTNLILHHVGKVEVGQEIRKGYINATSMALAHREKTGKRRDPASWLGNKRTRETLEHLSLTTGIPVVKLVVTVEGKYGGTYIHPRLAIRFAMWLSDDFGLVVEDWVSGWQRVQHMHQESNWKEQRISGKSSRSALESAIASFQEYAKGQGSQGFKHYHNNFTRTIYAALFDVKVTAGLRELLDESQLRHLALAEDLVARIIVEAIAQGMPYKDIYELAKTRVGKLSELLGKSPVLVAPSGGA